MVYTENHVLGALTLLNSTYLNQSHKYNVHILPGHPGLVLNASVDTLAISYGPFIERCLIKRDTKSFYTQSHSTYTQITPVLCCQLKYFKDLMMENCNVL